MIVILNYIRKFFSQFSWKDIIYLAAIVLLLLLLIRGCSRKPTTVVNQPVLRPTTQKTDKKGTSYTEIKGTLYTESQMKAVADSLQRVLGKGNVVHVTRTITLIDTVFQQDTLYVDNQTGEIYVADSNKNVQLSYKGNYKTKTGSFHMVLTQDTATGVTTIRKHLLKADELVLNEYHTNPLFIPSQGYVYTAKVPKVLGSIGGQVGVGYGTNGKVIGYVGFGIGFNLIGIKSRK